MRYHAIACDYDGTLAANGTIDPPTMAALDRARASGRKLILVTGRELPDLRRVCPDLHRFDAVVAENGALLYRSGDGTERVLGEPPPEAFVRALRDQGVMPLSTGRVIVATWEPHETAVLETIHRLGLELQVVFNKGAIMVLPSGINKATGLEAALAELHLSRHNVVGIGDAENDHAFLQDCECAVAVANAIPQLKARVDFVTDGARGAGVAELIDRLLASDLEELAPRLGRHATLLGRDVSDGDVQLPPYGANLLLAGTSGSGKSTFALGFLERLADRGYQICIIDPEGDYATVEDAVVLGDPRRAPLVQEVMDVLQGAGRPCVVNLLGIEMADRPAFFDELVAPLLELRSRTGRPHWIVVDEAHHLLPTAREAPLLVTAEGRYGLLLITVHPEHVARVALDAVDLVIATGEAPAATLQAFGAAVGAPVPQVPDTRLRSGEGIAWWRRSSGAPFPLRSVPPAAERQRHRRKYAAGELGPDKSFFFRGPEGKLNLRAQNLTTFLQLADGVDDETWTYHLRRGDYSHWVRQAIKDETLAEEIARIERAAELDARQSRADLKRRIEARYTGPA